MKTINLRGHHLGAIYDVVAMVKVIRRADNFWNAIDKHTIGMLNYGYPKQTADTVNAMLKNIFERKTKIHVVDGLDDICDICNAGHIREIKKRNDIFERLCKPKRAEPDLKIMLAFNCEIGKTYLAEEIIKKAEELAKKTRAADWGLLLIRIG